MVALRLLKTRVQLQHALTFSVNDIGLRVPDWTTYARPWCERSRGFTTLTVNGVATRIQATVYRMRREPTVAAGHQLVDGGQAFAVTGVGDLPSGFIEVRVA